MGYKLYKQVKMLITLKPNWMYTFDVANVIDDIFEKFFLKCISLKWN